MNQLRAIAVAGLLAATFLPRLPPRYRALALRFPIRSTPNGQTLPRTPFV